MKTIVFLIFLLMNVLISKGQIQAVTSTGQEVILYENKTWDYATKSEAAEIAVNKTKFLKNEKSTFLLKSNKTNVGFYLNPKKWSFKKAGADEAAEYTFELKDKDAYGIVITERTEIPLESLKDIAVENAREAAPDIKVVKEEYRTVNGQKVFCMQMIGTISGIKATYFGYYYSSEKGSIQFLTYTAQNLFNEYKADMEELVNGFVVID